jgi:hypothetical protein
MKQTLTVIGIALGAIIAGWAMGRLGGLILAPELKRLADPPVWYCIEGKVYERFGETYATVVPPRECLPVSKD